MDSVAHILTLDRTYPHPREMVYRAWTEPARLEKWFSPSPKNRIVAKVDLRVGGSYRISMIPPSGDGWVVGGFYREIVPQERLVFSWQWEDSAESPSLVTVEFLEVDGGTQVRITHSDLESSESAQNHELGWVATLDRLGDYCEDIMEWLAGGPVDLLSAGVQIDQAKKLAEMGLNHLRRTLQFVPEERRSWSPSDTAKSSLRIALHVAIANRRFAALLRGDLAPYQTARELANSVYAEESDALSWDDALAMLDESKTEVLDAYEHVDPRRLMTDGKVAFVLSLVGRHADGHAAQIEYLQTVWGDTVDHF